jgi:2-polyprenyl-6-hydroxyphenyl methylase/3-demethylubiquinone-9 3-methyltransferase
MNADPAELLKFNALARKWWAPDGAFRFLHKLNPLRLQWVEDHMPLAGKHILDIGCGGGILSEAMARQGAHVTAIDLAADVLEVAQAHARKSGLSIDYRLISAEALASKTPCSYDGVTCMELLEHVPDPAAIVQATACLLKPEGIVCFATLNRNMKSFIYAIAGAEYLMGALPEGTHRHESFITPAELAQFSRDAKMEVEALTGIGYSLAKNTFSLTRDTSVNYLMACRRTS